MEIYSGHMSSIFQFLTEDPIGLVILSIISSIIGGIIFELLKRSYKNVLRKYKRRKFVKYLTNVAVAHICGQRAVQIRLGDISQNTFWAADYVITYVKHIGVILGLLLLLCILLLILPSELYWLPIVIISIIVTFRYKLLKRHCDLFNMIEDMVFGKKYLEKEKEGYMKYWDSIYNKKEHKNIDDVHNDDKVK